MSILRGRTAALAVALSLSLSGPVAGAHVCADRASDPAVAAALAAALDAADARLVSLDPLGALRRGDRSRAASFGAPLADATLEARRAAHAATLADLDAIEPEALGQADRLAYRVLRYETEHALKTIRSGAARIDQLTPLDTYYGAQVSFPDLSTGSGTVRFETAADFEAGLARMDGYVAHLDRMVARLGQGLDSGHVQARLVVDQVIGQLDAMLASPLADSPFLKPFDAPGLTLDAEAGARLEAAYEAKVAQAIRPAYARLRAFLADTYRARARTRPGLSAMTDGAMRYRLAVERYTTTRLTPDEIHAFGRAEVARLTEALEDARARAGFDGSLQDFFTFLRTDDRFYFDRPAPLFAGWKEIEADVRAAMPRLFDAMPAARFAIRPLPVAGENRGAGYYQAPPADGSAPGILFVNVSDMRSRPKYYMETLLLHEGIPGHHYQLSLVREQPGLPDKLRYGRFTAYTEGWGLYAESLGRDLGMFDDPYQWFGRLDYEMIRAIRLVVDTGLHHKGWSRQQAIDYMLAHTSMAPKDVTLEIDRYISMPGQALAYKIGEAVLQRLRDRAEAAFGDAFDIRAFHTQLLDTGALPLDLLEAKIDRWIACAAP
ncbi:uncharacterized protein (DUF885 family) [Rhodothalassium salexigens DSM 2132]|uniref:Uncharacterized protein (DUF885 family) n=1 Tax=Rhodothalassium salexigens DSM 2132 TaxID=1188247 RepID=A0A4V6NQX9_RHOSA|nr:DUF885 domain-containing protein [Rhodothalassium salexigens]MBB4210302.1 uncharacterized protein (DUF885 family) [Rhodothalassium salexigens DSM 2132]MBK1639211.1 hypothetical protein [Rhodothalassium salexigens DSM 2132]TCP38466.1 uncharacterized protein (DUF885 family) [Rhodothalassium salexigens DSM 2132]